MPTANVQNVETALEEVNNIHLPENETVFELSIREINGHWEVDGIVGPFAHRIQDGHPYPTACILSSFDLEFASREAALNYAQKLHDVLVKRGKQPDSTTHYLLEQQ